jgi:5-methylcytosine-specific restriction protein B
LRDYVPLAYPIQRREFFDNPHYKTRLLEIRESHNSLFYNLNLNLNQGSYLTGVPPELAAVFNSIHIRLAGIPIPHLPETLTDNPAIAETEVKGAIDHGFLVETSVAVRRSGLIFPEGILQRFVGSLLTKPFLVLTGLSGSGKTKLAQAFAQWITPNPAEGSANPRIALIPVGADWMGNENIVGYANGLDPKAYVTTPALELILHASKDDQSNIPHFLILDEMNLSHVERYFADFLSAIESGEEIPLYQGPERMAGATVIPNKLSLPKNLFVIGTVNVDETTYMFSPKVLDRANVIEFRMDKRDLEQFLSNPTKPDLSQLAGKGRGFGPVFVNVAADATKLVPSEVKAKFDDEIRRFFEVLTKEGTEFGYRTAYEAGRFLYFYNELRDKVEGEEAAQWVDSAFDAVIVQKFLPKLHGSSSKLSRLLHELLELCQSVASDDLQMERETRFPVSATKIARMIKILERNGFVSFAEA